jgi:hypothetical protein
VALPFLFVSFDNHQLQKYFLLRICSNRDREEQEIGEKMARGVIGVDTFQENIEKRVVEIRRPKRGRPRK